MAQIGIHIGSMTIGIQIGNKLRLMQAHHSHCKVSRETPGLVSGRSPLTEFQVLREHNQIICLTTIGTKLQLGLSFKRSVASCRQISRVQTTN